MPSLDSAYKNPESMQTMRRHKNDIMTQDRGEMFKKKNT